MRNAGQTLDLFPLHFLSKKKFKCCKSGLRKGRKQKEWYLIAGREMERERKHEDGENCKERGAGLPPLGHSIRTKIANQPWLHHQHPDSCYNCLPAPGAWTPGWLSQLLPPPAEKVTFNVSRMFWGRGNQVRIWDQCCYCQCATVKPIKNQPRLVPLAPPQRPVSQQLLGVPLPFVIFPSNASGFLFLLSRTTAILLSSVSQRDYYFPFRGIHRLWKSSC